MIMMKISRLLPIIIQTSKLNQAEVTPGFIKSFLTLVLKWPGFIDCHVLRIIYVFALKSKQRIREQLERKIRNLGS